MPLTPFVGLSIIIHMCIIALHKFFSWGTGRTVRHKELRVTHWISLAVVTFVFIFIATNAGILVYVSLLERHSLIHMINQLAASKDVIAQFQISQILAATRSIGELYKPDGMLAP